MARRKIACWHIATDGAWEVTDATLHATHSAMAAELLLRF